MILVRKHTKITLRGQGTVRQSSYLFISRLLLLHRDIGSRYLKDPSARVIRSPSITPAWPGPTFLKSQVQQAAG